MKWKLPLFVILIAGGIFWIFTDSKGTESSIKNANTKNEVESKTNKSGQGIQFFKGTWKEAKQKAKEEGKPIFVDAYATWCAPCKIMSRRVFTKKEVGDFYNKNFINYKYDMEKGTGPKFRANYNVTAYPTLIYFDSDSGKVKEVHRKRGAIGPQGLIDIGKKALNKAES